MSPDALPYCGAAPHPGELLERFNLDPALLASLALLAIFHARYVKGTSRIIALSGWAIATVAFCSPLCALSVALFSARVGPTPSQSPAPVPRAAASDDGWSPPAETTNDYTSTLTGPQ
ncbi:MAG: hypothetical protein JOZ93_17405 [Sinobacteraceae bacterium]|nr:hypothetical protein [Nevskiaceae bacterium]